MPVQLHAGGLHQFRRCPATQIPSDMVAFADFMRFLAPPTPSTQGIPGNPSQQSIQTGKQCSRRRTATCATRHRCRQRASCFTPGLSHQNAQLFSDLLVHNMGAAWPTRFRKAPRGRTNSARRPCGAWGSGCSFLHDGRATPANGGLLTGDSRTHAGPGSEANDVIQLFQPLTDQQKQDLLNFLRSL